MDDAPAGRIVFLHDAVLPNRTAASEQILSTAAALAASGVPATYLCGPSAEPARETLARYGIEGVRIPEIRPALPAPWWPRPVRDLLMRRTLRRALADCGSVAAIVARGEGALRAMPALRAMLDGLDGGRDGGRPVLLAELHRLDAQRCAELLLGTRVPGPASWPRPARRLDARERRAIAAADGLVSLTPELRDLIRVHHGCPDLPALVLPSGTSVAAERDAAERTGAGTGAEDVAGATAPAEAVVAEASASGPTPGRVDVLYAGKLEVRKGVRALLDALVLLPGITACIAGGEPAAVEALRARVGDRGLADRVFVPGHLPAAALPDLYRRARVAICPADPEADSVAALYSSPMKLLRAMGSGLPVVATATLPVRRIATDGVDAVLVPAGDAQAMADAIRALLDDPSRAAGLARAGLERARQFAWPVRAAALRGFVVERSAALARGTVA